MGSDEFLDMWEEKKWQRIKDGLRLRGSRMALGWSLRTAAEVTGLSASYIGQIERGEASVTERALRIFGLAYKKAETLVANKEAGDGSC